MFKSVEACIDYYAATPERGSDIYQHEINRALNHAIKQNICATSFDLGFEIERCGRILFSSQSNWIDVLIALKHPSSGEKKKFVVIYESDTDAFVGVSEIFYEPRCLELTAGALPFALATRSFADSVMASEEEMKPLTSRREVFMQGIVAALVPILGFVAPATAAVTSSQTCPSTNSNTSKQTTYGTSGATTRGGDQDTKEDTRTDNVTDSKTDCVTDTKQDP